MQSLTHMPPADDEYDEARTVVAHVQQLHLQGVPYHEMAVLYRIIKYGP